MRQCVYLFISCDCNLPISILSFSHYLTRRRLRKLVNLFQTRSSFGNLSREMQEKFQTEALNAMDISEQKEDESLVFSRRGQDLPALRLVSAAQCGIFKANLDRILSVNGLNREHECTASEFMETFKAAIPGHRQSDEDIMTLFQSLTSSTISFQSIFEKEDKLERFLDAMGCVMDSSDTVHPQSFLLDDTSPNYQDPTRSWKYAECATEQREYIQSLERDIEETYKPMMRSHEQLKFAVEEASATIFELEQQKEALTAEMDTMKQDKEDILEELEALREERESHMQRVVHQQFGSYVVCQSICLLFMD